MFDQFREAVEDQLLENDPEQYEILQELLFGMDSMNADEYEKKKDMLEGDALRVLEQAEGDFCDGAVGWD